MDFNKFLVFDDEIFFAPSATSSMSRIAPFFRIDHHDFDGQPRMWKNVREIKEFIKKIKPTGPSRTFAPPDHTAFFLFTFNKLLRTNEWLDNEHLVRFEQSGNFVTNGRQGTMLDLNEPITRKRINPIIA
jgi:hypothetical protein